MNAAVNMNAVNRETRLNLLRVFFKLVNMVSKTPLGIGLGSLEQIGIPGQSFKALSFSLRRALRR